MTSKDFNATLKDIESLKIQGARNVALAAISAFCTIKPGNNYANSLIAAKKKLLDARPTEHLTQNALNYILDCDLNQTSLELFKDVVERSANVEQFILDSQKKIIDIGSQKIKDGMVVATHCHSSTVVNILIAAKKQGKKFKVLNTETRPLFQGRLTAKNLIKEGIDVTMHVDSAAGHMLKKADIFLIGADAISSEGSVYNKIGSGIFAHLANQFDCPVYVCANTWKMDPSTIFGEDIIIEERDGKEIWDKAPKKLKLFNPAFERIDADHIRAIISEIGIYAPEQLIVETQRQYPNLFKD